LIEICALLLTASYVLGFEAVKAADNALFSMGVKRVKTILKKIKRRKSSR